MNAVRRSLTIADLRMETVAKWSGRAALAVGVFAFAISFAQIKWVAEENGIQPQWLAWLFPFLIDLPSLAASALTVALHDRPFRVRLYAWLVLGFFSAVSWICNGVHALSVMAENNNSFVRLIAELTASSPTNGWLIALVLAFAGIPPIGIVLGVHLWAYALRHSQGADQRVEAPVTTKKPATAPKAADTAPTETAAPPKAETAPAPAETAPLETVDEEQLVRAEFAARVEALKPGETLDSIKASEIGAAVVKTAVAATVRRWVKALKDEHLAASQTLTEDPEQSPRHASQEPTGEVVAERERETVSAA